MPRYNGGFIGTDGLDAPDPVTDVSAAIGDAQASISFTAPTDTGTSAITGFVAQVASSGDNYSAGSNTGTSSPIVVSSLSNGTSYTAKVWAINAYGTSAPSEASSSFAPAAPRGLFAGGNQGDGDYIDYITIGTTGNATDFGNLSASRALVGAVGSSSRGVYAGGSPVTNEMQYVTIASTGNTSDFGDLPATRRKLSHGVGNDTRGVFCAGENDGGAAQQDCNYITIASTGDSTNFGNCSAGGLLGGASSTTRGILHGGQSSDTTRIEYITIGTTGNFTDFGNQQSPGRTGTYGGSSSTRALFSGGFDGGGKSDIIEYITIASTGNATDFGNLSAGNNEGASCSSKVRYVVAGGEAGSVLNEIQYVTIDTTGNTADFGDLTVARNALTGLSNSHGGI